jgi:hypothetical protein
LKISYLPHTKIDKIKWDRCIDNASNGLIYAYSFYLDSMSENWDALILNDYEVVMPLTWNKKFRIRYLRQPAFSQQLGVFGNSSVTKNITESFIYKALQIFPFAEINLNYGNKYQKSSAKKCNLILSLNKPFADIEKSFRKDLVKKIKSNDLKYRPSDEVEKTINLFKENYSTRIHASQNDYNNFSKLCFILKNKEQLFLREVSTADGKLLASAIFFKDSRRIYYIMSVTLPDGRKLQANYFLLYRFIEEFCEQNLIFDFEGSEIPSIQAFFKKFGPKEQSYPFLKINNLTGWQKAIKKCYDLYKYDRKNN